MHGDTALPYSLQVEIESDPAKDAANQGKHDVSLAFGADVLADDNRLEVLDVRFDDAEDVFTLRGEVHRINSVREADDRETQRYYQTPR